MTPFIMERKEREISDVAISMVMLLHEIKAMIVSRYRHECEPISHMLITVNHDAIQGVMPLDVASCLKEKQVVKICCIGE